MELALQALVDRNCFVAASALVSGIHLMHVNGEVVRRWVNEVQTALQSDNQSVQYHALALLHQIKRQDRLAISKVVASLTRTPLKSALAQCLLIRFAKKVIEEEPRCADGLDPCFASVVLCVRMRRSSVGTGRDSGRVEVDMGIARPSGVRAFRGCFTRLEG